MSARFQAPRGTRDWYGEDAAVRRRVLDLAR
jgi:histidyl-tRNA synthetase